MTTVVKVRFLGLFKKAYGKGETSLEVQEKARLSDLIGKLTELSPELERLLIDPELGNPLPNAVILVNGKEIGVLNGLKMEVRNSDEIVFIPVTHGG